MELEVETALEAAGFVADPESKSQQEDYATKAGLHNGGAYSVVSVWKKGLVTALIEQNNSTEEQNGVKSQIMHQPVVVISGPGGKTVTSADDIECVLLMADQLG